MELEQVNAHLDGISVKKLAVASPLQTPDALAITAWLDQGGHVKFVMSALDDKITPERVAKEIARRVYAQ